MKWIEEHLTGFMIIVLILIFAIWFFSAPILFYLFGSPLSVGEAGDIFGAIGALFSGLAFWGLIWALLLQRIELKLQREELKATREELALTRKANEESAEMLEKQKELAKIQIQSDIARTLIDTINTSESKLRLKIENEFGRGDDSIIEYIKVLLLLTDDVKKIH